MTDYPKCIWRLPNGDRCPEYAAHDGECAIHLDYGEMGHDLSKETFNVLFGRTRDATMADAMTDELMNKVIWPHLGHIAARHIGYREENKSWAKRVDQRSAWARKLVQRVIDMRYERDNAREEASALEKSRALDRLVIERQRQRLISGARDRAKIVAERAFAREAETRLRSDFGELAKDLKRSIANIKGVLTKQDQWLLQDLHSWRATAEILADKTLSDNLDEVRKAPIEDFGEVPRPEWRCHIHPNLEPLQRLDGSKICSDGMCIQGEGD